MTTTSSIIYTSANSKITTPIKSYENYGKAGLINTTKKEIVPIETSKTDFIE